MLRKKRPIRLVLIVAAALVALASVLQGALAAAPVFDGIVLSGYKYTTTTGDQFSLVSVAPLGKVAIDLSGESLIVVNKSCSAGRMFEVCYDGATFKGYNHSLADREVYEFRIKISLVAPEIVVAKILDKAQLDVGESTIVHVNITNTGAAQGTAYFSEAVPVQLKITELPDQVCELSLNNIFIMVADLKDGELRHCDYKITALSPGAYALDSAVSYNVIKTEKATATATVAVNPLPFSVVENISDNLLLGDSLNISFLLRPTASLGAFVFNAWVPSQVNVISVNKEAVLEKQSGGANVAYGDKISALNETPKVNISTQLAYVGTSVISISSSWVYNGLQQSLVKDILINATFGRPYLRVSSYDSETEKLYMEVVNPAHLAIYKVTVIPATASGKAAFSASEISTSSHASFSDTPTQLPGFNSSQASYNGTIVYHTGYGQELSTKFNLTINSSHIYKATPAAENDTTIAESGPANAVNTTGREIPKLEKPPKTKLPATEIKTALVMVGVIILVIGLFFLIRSRGGSYREEANSDDELRN